MYQSRVFQRTGAKGSCKVQSISVAGAAGCASCSDVRMTPPLEVQLTVALPSDDCWTQGPSRVDAVGADGSCDPHVEGDAQGNCKGTKLSPTPAESDRQYIELP